MVTTAVALGDIVLQAREQLNRLTGLDLSSTLSVKKTEEGWLVVLEMVEKHSIPEQMDILARYEVSLDANGNLLEFHRQGLRKRVETVRVTDEESAP